MYCLLLKRRTATRIDREIVTLVILGYVIKSRLNFMICTGWSELIALLIINLFNLNNWHSLTGCHQRRYVSKGDHTTSVTYF